MPTSEDAMPTSEDAMSPKDQTRSRLCPMRPQMSAQRWILYFICLEEYVHEFPLLDGIKKLLEQNYVRSSSNTGRYDLSDLVIFVKKKYPFSQMGLIP
jgi:hypothetical protein